ncbi:MAG: hypothetical protein WD599_00335, partial [Balneolaceae bacterium]
HLLLFYASGTAFYKNEAVCCRIDPVFGCRAVPGGSTPGSSTISHLLLFYVSGTAFYKNEAI